VQETNLSQPRNSKLEAVIEGIAHELGLDNDKRLVDDILDPCIIVIIGASGDLAGRKLLPALFSLYLQGGLQRSQPASTEPAGRPSVPTSSTVSWSMRSPNLSIVSPGL
jgi:hypothetical protein